MPCLICGDPKTVQSHIIPRAFYRSIAGDEQHGYESSRFKRGVKYQAKGLFDSNILCLKHEAMLGEADAYGIAFVRDFHTAGKSMLHGDGWQVPNPRPELLVSFVASLIWRRGVSQVQREEADLDLGFAEPRLRALLFGDDKSYDPPLMVSKRPITSQGVVLHELMFEPAKHYGWGTNSWFFYVMGVEFVMQLNRFVSEPIPWLYQANGKTAIMCHVHKPTEAHKVEGFLDLAVNMFLDPKTGKARELR